MSRTKVIVGIFLVMVILAGCAPGPNSLADAPNDEGEVAGFWMGLWHGFASPVIFIISLFNKSVEIYEVHNNGGWYTFGFLLGASVILVAAAGEQRELGVGAGETNYGIDRQADPLRGSKQHCLCHHPRSR